MDKLAKNLIGTTLGKYSLTARLGVGGMGTVYKAHQPRLDRYVAIKVLHAHLAEDPNFVSRFEREATAIARLSHPNIVRVYDFDADDGVYYMVMELLHGPTLKDEIQERRKQQGFSLKEMVKITVTLLDAVGYAHNNGVLHRDIKPSNVILTSSGQVMLTDFGLARILDATRLTTSGTTSGTPEYMSPEQAQGESGDERSDLYSLGVILYEMAAGRLPFEGETRFATVMSHITTEPTPPTHYNAQLPVALEGVILTAMQKKAEDRFQTAEEMAAALRATLDHSAGTLTPIEILALAPHPEADQETETPGTITPTRPYRGLFAFREEDARFFFGRETFTERLVKAVEENGMAAVVGPSGSGKSSVVFAGLLPRLRRTARWAVTSFRPGSRPFQSLADALLLLLEPGMSEVDRLVETRKLAQSLDDGLVSLADVVQRILRRAGEQGPERLLLVVDQFEEIYTLCAEADVRRRFTMALLEGGHPQEAGGPAPLAVVFTLRADFVGQALSERAFAEALQKADVKLGPMTREELIRAIESPAALLGVTFEPGLVDRILEDIGEEAGNLPLLEFALTLMWDRRAGRRLTHAAYEAIGRVEGALARYAEKVYARLGEDEKLLARRVFTQMVRPGRRTEDTRRRALRAELGEEGWALVHRLADERLVVTGQDVGGQESGEVIHEVLIRGWQRLREWMEADREFRSWQDQLRVSMYQWLRGKRDEAALLRGSLLVEAEKWLAAHETEISPDEREFIEASVALRQSEATEREAQRQRELEAAQRLAQEQQQRAEEQTQAARRLRSRAWLLAGALVIAALLAVLAFSFASQSHSNFVMAQGNAQTADANARLAENHAQAAATSAAQAEANAREAEANAQQSQANARLALARQLAAQSGLLIEDQDDLALLLSLEANRLADLPETRSSLLTALQDNQQRAALLWGHVNDIQAVTFSPDGSLLASVGMQGMVRLWTVDYPPGGPLRIQPLGEHLQGHDEQQLVNCVTFSPDGSRIVTGSDDGTARLWDVATGQLLQTLEGDVVQGAVFLADGHTVALGGFGTLRLWNLDSNQAVVLPNPQTDIIWSISLNPGGTRLAVGSADDTVTLWDVQARNLITQTASTGSDISALAFSRSGALLAAADGTPIVRLFDGTTGAPLQVLTTTIYAYGAMFLNDQTLLLRSKDGQVTFWDIGTGQQFGSPLDAMSSGLHNMAISPDDRLLVTTTKYGVIEVWDLSGELWLGQPIPAAYAPDLRSLAYHPSGQMAVSGGYEGQILRFDPVSGQTLGEPFRMAWPGNTAIVDLALAPTGEKLVVARADGTSTLWDLTSGETRNLGWSNQAGDVSLTYRSDGRFVSKGGINGRVVTVYVAADYSMVMLAHEGPITGLTLLLPFGMVSTGEDGYLRLWAVDQYQNIYPAHEIVAHEEGVNALAVSPQQLWAATGGAAGGVRLWSVASGEPLAAMSQAHRGRVLALAFAATEQGMALYSMGEDGRVLRWELGSEETPAIATTPVEILTFGPGATVAALAFDSVALGYGDGRVVAASLLAPDALSQEVRLGDTAVTALALGKTSLYAGGQDGTLRSWPLNDPSQPLNLVQAQPMLNGIVTMRFSPDGKLLASAAINGSIFLFDSQSGELIHPPLQGHPVYPSALAFTPDGKTLTSGSCGHLHYYRSGEDCDQGELILWDIASGTERARLNALVSYVNALDISPDGKLLAAGGCTGHDLLGFCTQVQVLLWDLTTLQPLEVSFSGHSYPVRHLAFSPAGDTVASISFGEMLLWNVHTGQTLGAGLFNANARADGLAFSPDGKLLASSWYAPGPDGSYQGQVILLGAASGQPIGRPLVGGFLDGVLGLAFSPDNTHLLLGDSSGGVMTWDMRLESWRTLACRIANRNLSQSEWAQYLGTTPYQETCPRLAAPEE